MSFNDTEMMDINIVLAAKCRTAEEHLSSVFSGFTLFCLIQREETAGTWDVVASAPWLTTNRAGIQHLLDGLRPYLSNEDWLQIGSVVPVDPQSSFVQTMTRLFDKEHDLFETSAFRTNDFTVDRAIIITANKNPIRMKQVQPVAA